MPDLVGRRAVPGDLLLHPVALGAVALLVLNDHVLKAAFPGVVTGKLSDAAGLVVAPVVLTSIMEIANDLARRPWGPSRRVTTIAVLSVGLGFAAVKVLAPAADAYRHGLAVLQWPFAAGLALLRSAALPDLQPVAFIADPTDLVVLPALVIPILLGRARARRDAVAG